jgi:cation:H+ antiporter
VPDLLLWTLVLVAALAVLVKRADIFVDHSAAMPRVLGVPDFVVGVTLVALGTSLPELAASLVSVFTGAGEFVAGTVIGSNVANIAFITGAAALAFRGFSVTPKLMRMDLPVMILAAFVVSLMAMSGGISRGEGVILLIMYGFYLTHKVREQRRAQPEAKEGVFKASMIIWIICGAAAVYAGAEFTVKSVIKLTELLGLADASILALTVVAVGSSLPELVVSLTAAKKNHNDLSVGNVVGSNICNSFLVMGAPAIIKPLPVSASVWGVGVPFMIAASLIFWIFAQRGVVGRTSGFFLLLIFALFLGTLCGIFRSGLRAQRFFILCKTRASRGGACPHPSWT